MAMEREFQLPVDTAISLMIRPRNGTYIMRGHNAPLLRLTIQLAKLQVSRTANVCFNVLVWCVMLFILTDYFNYS